MSKKYYYKAMNKDMQGFNNFQFEVGKVFKTGSQLLKLDTNKVFHFCEKLEDTLTDYWDPTDRHFLIEVPDAIIYDEVEVFGANKIKIVKEISREEIEEHIQDKDTFNAKRFLAKYITNIKLLETLSKDIEPVVRRNVVKNINIPVYLLEELAKDEEWHVRRAVAQNLNTPTHLLEELSKDEILEIHWAVAQNLNTPTYLLEELSKDKKWSVRRAVANNLNTPVHILEELSKDEICYVREAVAENLNVPVYLLEHLAKDEDVAVSNKAKEILKEITQ